MSTSAPRSESVWPAQGPAKYARQFDDFQALEAARSFRQFFLDDRGEIRVVHVGIRLTVDQEMTASSGRCRALRSLDTKRPTPARCLRPLGRHQARRYQTTFQTNLAQLSNNRRRITRARPQVTAL